MTKIDENFDKAVSTRWGKRIVILLALIGLAFFAYKIFG